MTVDVHDWITCTVCGKHSYPARRTARRAARINHPGAPLQVYECRGGGWHYGNPRGGERERITRTAPPTPAAVDPTRIMATSDRERMVLPVLAALASQEWLPIGHLDLAVRMGYERRSVDSRNVLAALRLLARRGQAMPVGYGYVATQAGRDELPNHRRTCAAHHPEETT